MGINSISHYGTLFLCYFNWLNNIRILGTLFDLFVCYFRILKYLWVLIASDIQGLCLIFFCYFNWWNSVRLLGTLFNFILVILISTTLASQFWGLQLILFLCYFKKLKYSWVSYIFPHFFIFYPIKSILPPSEILSHKE